MPEVSSDLTLHPLGEPILTHNQPISVDTGAGKLLVEWDPDASVTVMGHLVFFFQYLSAGCLWTDFIRSCPLKYTSPNAPKIVDILGTWLLTTLAGSKRYSHITALRADTVTPTALAMSKVVSEDSLRRSFLDSNEPKVVEWQTKTLLKTCEPFLKVPWILDVDVCVKTIHGHQEGAVVGYNPHKKGRPSHSYHTMFVRHIRLALDVQVLPGNKHEPVHGRENVWRVLDSLPREQWPYLICADSTYGTDDYMHEAEVRKLRYLFRMRANPAVQKTFKRLAKDGKWAQRDDRIS